MISIGSIGAIHAAGLPENFAKMFESGKSFDKIQNSRTRPVTLTSSSKSQNQKILQVRRFARRYRYKQEHSNQVLRLSKILFEKLKVIHGLGGNELFLLTCAAILHDIGWINGQKAHHKTSMQIILNDRTLPFDQTERKIIALVARYHRKSAPKQNHTVYQELTEVEQKHVQFLSGILRIADGLDRSHMNVVKDIDVRISDFSIEFICKIQNLGIPEISAAKEKADLFEKVTGRLVQFVLG